jgi:hypothetical protein
MKHADFTLGGTFWCSERQWRCTDIGSRTIVAIRIDSVEVASSTLHLPKVLSRGEAEAEGWFNGPPYAVLETVFDESDLEACSLDPGSEGAEASRQSR